MFSIYQTELFSLCSHLRNLEPGVSHGNNNIRVPQTEEVVFVSQFHNCRNHAIFLLSYLVWRILIRLCIFTHEKYHTVCFCMFFLNSYGSYKNTNALLFSHYFLTNFTTGLVYFVYWVLACTTIYVLGGYIWVNLIVLNHAESLWIKCTYGLLKTSL